MKFFVSFEKQTTEVACEVVSIRHNQNGNDGFSVDQSFGKVRTFDLVN